MQIDIGTLDQETTDVLTSIVATENARRAALDPPEEALTNAQYLSLRVSEMLASYVRTSFEKTVAELGADFRAKDYATRQAAIAALKST